MRVAFFLFLLSILFTAHSGFAQSVTNPANQRWHWFRDTAFIRHLYRISESPADWELISKRHGQRLICRTTNGHKDATYSFKQDKLVAITYHYVDDISVDLEWIWAKAVQVREHEWVDKPSNARIKWRRQGRGSACNVRYEAFTAH
jgi:hypothetical protein